MPIFKPFKAFHPKPEQAKDIASRPYDVLTSEEAREEAKGNPLSFLHVVKPEIDLPKGVASNSGEVFKKGKENLQKLIDDGVLTQDDEPCFYVYAQTMHGKTQYGLVGCASIEDYQNGIVKKHEQTRPDKEEERTDHVRTTNYHTAPIFLAYKNNLYIDMIIQDAILLDPVYSFVADDAVSHYVWLVDNGAKVRELERMFREEVECLYIADGHHRTAAAVTVGEELKNNNPNHTGEEAYNFFLSVAFPESQLTVVDYNRVVKDLNGMSASEFLRKLEKSFVVEEKGDEIFFTERLHTFSMYLESKWYSLTAKENTYSNDDPIAELDVTILDEEVLRPLFDIQDFRTSDRIDFVGGIRGLGELKRRVDSGEMAVAFALAPVTMEQIMAVADAGEVMPPKTTWFEPKLRSGLFVHSLDL